MTSPAIDKRMLCAFRSRAKLGLEELPSPTPAIRRAAGRAAEAGKGGADTFPHQKLGPEGEY